MENLKIFWKQKLIKFKYISNESNGIICTGKWGCGAFGNDPILKLLQMFIVGSVLGKKEDEIHFHWMNENNLILNKLCFNWKMY